MAKNCKACEELRQNAANVLTNGIDDTACTSLKNNTGFNPSTPTNDCADLEDANDCLVGNMADEIEAYDVCDWKEFMRKFIPNGYTVLKGIICAVCGLWTKVSNEEKKFEKYDCAIDKLSRSVPTVNIPSGSETIRFPEGVSQATGSGNAVISMMGNQYAGYMTGTIQFTKAWEDSHRVGAVNGVGELLYEYHIKPKNHNMKHFWPFVLNEGSNGAGWVAHTYVFTEGERPYGKTNDGNKSENRRPAVPKDYWYIQVRVYTIGTLSSNRLLNLSGTGAWLINNMVDC